MFYLKVGFYLDAHFLVLAPQVYGAVKVVVRVGARFVHERHSGGQPLFPAISVCLHRIADGCSVEEKHV